MLKFVSWALGISSLIIALLFYLTTSDISENLSPQGCRMSWMSPSYILQADFDGSWTPLAHRYSLWLYREVGWDSVQKSGQRKGSLPVLFIPGNAGSSHQIRSIASSASRQYFSAPYVVSPTFESRLKPLDFFAVEFNEDLSAFHGSTLESQIAYTSKAISYILSLYPPDTAIIVMGHSMGGIVAASLLPSINISAIITMSTPHTLPPARFDSRIEEIYAKLQDTLEKDPTPITSICGGATDMMIPSESCILPTAPEGIFRRTIFTSALEGAWTGVGHQEMVWCHQVRWRVARTALELGSAKNSTSKANVVDKWLRAGLSLHKQSANSADEIEVKPTDSSNLPPGQNLVLRNPTVSKMYLLPVQESISSQQVTVLVSRGAIHQISPEHPISLRVSVFTCSDNDVLSFLRCTPLNDGTLKLIPNPIPGRSFPVPQEGSDESEGVVLFESYVPKIIGRQWIGVKVDSPEGQGWVIAGLSTGKTVVSEANTASLLLGPLKVPVPDLGGLRASVTFPNLLSNALVVYRVTPQSHLESSCSDTLLPPLLVHTSHRDETHYFPLTEVSNRRILLHTHLTAPFIDQGRHSPAALNFTMYSSAEHECIKELKSLDISIDWSATLGRWASRYPTTLVSWSAGVAGIVIFLAWSHQDQHAYMPSVEQSLARYISFLLRYLLPVSLGFSVFPLPGSFYLGNKGILFLVPLAPLIIFVSSGLVCVSWWTLVILLKIVGKLSTILPGSQKEQVSVARSTILSLAIVCLAIFLFVPWQVAYLGCWLLHLYTCASSMQYLSSHPEKQVGGAVPLIEWRAGNAFEPESPVTGSERRPSHLRDMIQNNLNHNTHILLLMTWLLPLTAPVLAVWVRTLLTAGFTTPFDGDHNFLAVLPFLIFADYASWTSGKLFDRPRFENRLPLRWLFAVIAGTAFLCGSRKPYLVLDMGRVAMWIIVILKIGRRYWGGSPWIA